MFRNEIRLITMKDVTDFVAMATSLTDVQICLVDNEGNRVSAKSLLGTLYSLEWKHTYCVSDKDISGKLLPWLI